MYDIFRQSKPSLCTFSPSTLAYYPSQSRTLLSLTPKPHHYQQPSHITQLIETICRELFYYANSMQKVNSFYSKSKNLVNTNSGSSNTSSPSEQHFHIQNILLENVKKILVHNLDKHGLIMEQRLMYLVVSFLHTRHNGVGNLREFLNEVHYVLTSSVWGDTQKKEVPFALVMLLNGQFEELIDYTKQQLANNSTTNPELLNHLLDLLVYKIEENQTKTPLPKPQIRQLIDSINDSQCMKKLISEVKKKGQYVFGLFETKYEIQMVLAILAGNQTVIEEVARGSWGLYLNLYVNFVERLVVVNQQQPTSPPKPSPSYETTIRSYIHKYFSTNRPTKKSTQQHEQIFLIKLLTTTNPHNRFSFHQIYQSSFVIFSPIMSNLIGLLLLECKVVDYFSVFNNKEYYDDVLVSLVDNCNRVSWTAFVNVVGFVHNYGGNNLENRQGMWENLMYQHLPYQISSNTATNPTCLQTQIKQIQQKLQDLNLINLSPFTTTYLNTLFSLLLHQPPHHLTEPILQVFFLTLQMSDPSNANFCFHQMKTFVSQYYRNHLFDYGLLDALEGIFDRKQSVLSEKVEEKIERLFCLVYKIRGVYEMVGEEEGMQGDGTVVVEQVKEFNRMFVGGSKSGVDQHQPHKKKKPISLCVELLRLGAYLHSRVENTITPAIGTQIIPQQTINEENQIHSLMATKKQQEQQTIQIVKQFEQNLHDYLNQWKSLEQPLSPDAIEQLSYFDKYFY